MKYIALFLSLIGSAVAQFTPNYIDNPNEGFLSTEPRTPVGGNTGTTLGAQRQIVLEEAISRWEQFLKPNGPVVIDASFGDLVCDADRAALAGASAVTYFRNFSGAPERDTWYPVALANHLAQRDLSANASEIRVRANLNVDSDPACAGGRGFYYGIDGMPGNQLNFLRVLIHEIGHGLGFSSLLNSSDGSLSDGFPDVYMKNLIYTPTETPWSEVSNQSRLFILRNGAFTVWAGQNTQLASPNIITNGARPLEIIIAGNNEAIVAAQASFGPPIPQASITGTIVLVDDGTAPTSDACQEPFVNAADIVGKIALIDRGTCTFKDKILRAERAGAIAAIVMNNAPELLNIMGGSTAPFPTIPGVSVTMNAGETLRNLPANTTITIQFTDTPGLSNGRPFIHTPQTFSSGSSISHFDINTQPNLLMEPALEVYKPHPDLAITLMRDLGWTVNDVPFPNQNYAFWADLNGISTSGTDDDMDGDGVSNFEEYAFGSDPDDATSLPPVTLARPNAAGGLLRITRSNQAVDIDYQLQSSTNARDFSDVNLTPINTDQITGEQIIEEFDLGDLSESTFFRVKATWKQE